MPYPRQPTEEEWDSLSQTFPNLTRDSVMVTDGKTSVYNCIAWALGYTDRWINPPNPIANFNALFLSASRRGYTKKLPALDDKATCDGFGKSDYEMTHASRKDGHDVTLTSSEMNIIEKLCTTVETDVQCAFETTFKAWKDKWFTGPAKFSSDTNSNKSFPEYKKLRRMGESILPLIVDKLSKDDNFPLLVLYDDIAEKDICVDANVPEFALEGEQARAIRTIKKYTRTQYQLGDSQMPTYNLSTTFTSQDLERFYATGTNVVIAKPTEGTQPNVAWVVYRPLRSNNINWEEQYGIYASNSEIQNGAKLDQITPNEPYPAIFEKSYTLNAAGNMIGPKEGGNKNAYTVLNEYDNRSGKGYIVIGLFQNANVDGQSLKGNAVSAASVLYKSTAVMTPFTTVYLWTQSQVKGNTVVTNISSAMTKVVFGGGVLSVDLRYDSDTGTFIPIANSVSLVEEGALEISAIYPLL